MAGGAVAEPFEDAQAAHSRRDYATALRLWRPLADQGNAEAQYALGFMYDGGQGVRKITLGLQSGRASQPIKAIPSPSTTWGPSTTAAWVPQNKAEALNGITLPPSASRWSQFNVGVLHRAGVAVSRTGSRLQVVSTLCRHDNIGAQVYLVLCYATGLGVPQDNIQAYMWLSLAAARSDQYEISNRNRVAQQMTPDIAEARSWRWVIETER